MFIGNSQKEARYLSFPVFIAVRFIASKVLNNSRYFDSICWQIFYRRNRRHRVTIMLFKLKSVLYPPDATVINRRRYKITRFFLAVAYEHCITMKHFRFGDKIETSLNLFSLFISKHRSFRDLRFGVMKTQTPGNK